MTVQSQTKLHFCDPAHIPTDSFKPSDQHKPDGTVVNEPVVAATVTLCETHNVGIMKMQCVAFLCPLYLYIVYAIYCHI